MANDNTNSDNTEDNATPAPVSINIGTSESDVGYTHRGNDVTDLGGGDDDVNSQDGVNIVDLGSGDDYATNTASTGSWDVTTGGSGDDVIIGPRTGFLNARGGSGDDTIIGGMRSDYLFGDEGEDIIFGDLGDDTITGGEGDDQLIGGLGADTFIYGQGDGDDTIHDFGVGADVLDLTNLGGTISWTDLQAKISDDGNGNVTIDLTSWGGGTITLNGIASTDLTETMFALPDGNTAADASGVFQDPDVDSVYMGSSGDDTITLDGTEQVIVTAGEGDDNVITGSGSDFVLGGEGDDTINTGDGDDTLLGGEGSDTLTGGAGDDWLIGGEGSDTLTGGTGADTFIFSPDQGSDTVRDFTVDEDTINLTLLTDITNFSQLTLTQEGTNTVIDLSSHGGGTITLENINVGDLDSDDFTFYEPPAEVESM